MTTAEAINLRASRVCQCGQPKVHRTAFCISCHTQLPAELQRGLWAKIGRGFETAYERAVKYLETGE